MTSIILSPNPLSRDDFKLTEFGKSPLVFGLGGKPADQIKPYTPYCVGEPSAQAAAIVASLSDVNTARCVTEACRIAGVDTMLGLAEMYSGLHSGGLSAASASFGAGTDSYKVFTKNLQQLESLYLGMHKAKAAGNNTQYNLLRHQAQSLHTSVNKTFATEVNRVTSTIKSRKGIPLKDFARAENIVSSSRNINKLNFLDLTQASNLSKFAKGAQIAGSGMLVFDFGVGVSKTYVDYQKGGNWHKTMFVESAKLGAAAGLAKGAMGTAMYLGLALTPVGWIVLAGTVAVIGYAAIQITSDNGGTWYDSIMGVFE